MIKKIYLAGPMAGFPEKNFPAFNAEAKRLRDLGYEVVNPAELESKVGQMDYMDYLKRDAIELVMCDGIAFLPGMRQSYGALYELITCIFLKIPITKSEFLTEPVDKEETGMWEYRTTKTDDIFFNNDGSIKIGISFEYLK